MQPGVRARGAPGLPGPARRRATLRLLDGEFKLLHVVEDMHRLLFGDDTRFGWLVSYLKSGGVRLWEEEDVNNEPIDIDSTVARFFAGAWLSPGTRHAAGSSKHSARPAA
jgi:hypothetical protein